ncbi:PAS domain-containing sensor histidine kinase, partial [Candidatus Gracilibacteria bacterium]|nr:PAS domain-containing sensor histidine kinase [Candidatus Gracilibacteria bacterium]
KIIEKWLSYNEIYIFINKFNITKDEKKIYIKYFGEKIIDFLLENFGENNHGLDEKYVFLTTKFFDYIKGKDIGIDDLLKIIIIIKNIAIKTIKCNYKILSEINLIFDIIGVILSKDYNSTIIKLLNEYKNAIDKSNIIAKINIWGLVTYVNDEFCILSGFNKEELMGKNYAEFSYTDTQKTIKELLNKIKNKEVWKGVIKSIKKNGEYYWLKSTVVPIVDKNNNILEYICIMTDITDIEFAKENLKQSFDKLKELDIKKDEFLNIASHELRTPMTSIKGYISMILEGDAGEINGDVKIYLEKVYNNVTRLINLINDMLDISKLEAEKQEFTFEKVDIKKFLLETSEEVQQLFKSKGQKFEININYENYYRDIDINMLKRVIINLLGNANKFTPTEKGEIKLVSFLKDENLYINIIDNGIGIDKKHFPIIFEKFGQIKNSLTRKNNGTGLGLPIAKSIIEKMGGTIEINSESGKGTNFSIILPINF